jgi:hypothetical protein
MARRFSRMTTRQLTATTNAGVLTGVQTPWMLMYPGTNLRVWAELRAATTNFRGVLRWRTADVLTSQPNAWQDSATTRSTNDEFVEDFDISASTSSLWVQAAIGVKTASSGQAGEAFGRLRASLSGDGAIVASETVQVEPTINTSQNAYLPIGGLFSALDLAGVMAGYVVTGVSGTLSYGLAIRYFKGDPNSPGAWTDLNGWTGVTADEIRNSGHQATTPGTMTFAQLGVKVPAGTNPRATIQVVAAGRWT